MIGEVSSLPSPTSPSTCAICKSVRPERHRPTRSTSSLIVAEKVYGFAPAAKPGTYDLCVSVGRRDATPVIALPYDNDDGHRRYKLGTVTVLPRAD